MKELVFQVWKSCFHLPMAILYTIHPRTFLMSPLHSLSVCDLWCTICHTFDILDQVICVIVLMAAILDAILNLTPSARDPDCTPKFFYLPSGALPGSRVKMRGHLIAHRTPLSPRTSRRYVQIYYLWVIGSCVCAFDWHQDRWPWMTFELYKFEFSENFSGFRRLRTDQQLNEWR